MQYHEIIGDFWPNLFLILMYRDEIKGLQILLSYIQAGPGIKAKHGHEEISRNHVQKNFLSSVLDDKKNLQENEHCPALLGHTSIPSFSAQQQHTDVLHRLSNE